MFPNIMNPYWWTPAGQFGGHISNERSRLPRIDIGGIYVLSTNAVQLSDESVDYGINPCLYNELPCESVVLLKIHADVPTGGDALPVTIVIPNSGRTTLTTTTTSAGTTNVPVVDSQDNPVTGANVTGTTERLAYINKVTGVIRFLEFTNV